MDTFFMSYLLLPVTIILAVLPWASVFKLPTARVALLPITGALFLGGLAEGLYQATQFDETPGEQVYSYMSGLSHLIPFLLTLLLYRPKGTLHDWKGALLGGTYVAVAVGLSASVAYEATDTYPYCMSHLTLVFSSMSGLLLALILGTETSSEGIYRT